MKTKFSGFLTLLLAFLVQITFAQEKTVSGTVSDDSGPLPGVSVVIKGTTHGAETDFDGKYSIKVNIGEILSFSYIGMETQEKTVGQSNTIDVKLISSGNVLDEVVVTAFGIKRKPDELTTSNQVVKAGELTKASPVDLASALVGKVSGLNIRQTNSGVNDSYTITLRGMRSFSASNEALIVIDGVPSTTSLFYALDPQSVQNINVMKGANGAALYGPKGSNGVIIVTTKKGNGGNDKGFTVNIKSSIDFEQYAYLPQRQTRYGQGWAVGGVFQHFVYENGAWGPEFDGSLIPVGFPDANGDFRFFPYETLGSDNIGAFFQKGLTTNNTVSVSAGSLDDGYFNLSVNNIGREFIIQDDKSKKSSVSLRAGKQFGNLSLQGSIQYLNNSSERASGSIYGDLLQSATNIDIAAFSSPRNETHWTGYFLSPYWDRVNVRSFSHSNRLNANFNVGYKINDNINLKATGSLYSSVADGFNYNNGYTDPAANSGLSGYTRTATSSYASNTSSYRTYYGDIISNFDYQLTDDLSLKANLGATLTQTTSTNNGASGENLTIAGFYNISNISGTPVVTDSKSLERGYAVFADVTFGYKDYLFLNATSRNDWTSKLAIGQNSFFYPSAGVSFIPTKVIESLKNSKVIDRIKFSYSYVKVGNVSGVSPYTINDTYSQASGAFYGAFPFGGLNSFIPKTSSTDPNIQPEFAISNEVGLTVELFKRRVRFDFSGYKGNTKNQISSISTSYASGLTSTRINIGAADTKGMEIDLGLTPIKTDDLNWDLNLSYSTSTMIVTKVSDQTDAVALTSGTGVAIFAEVGQPFPLIKGVDFTRDPSGNVVINPATGDPLFSPTFKVLGHTTPNYILGLNSTINYKGLALSVTADYRTGHQFYSGTKAQLAWSGYLVESAANGRQQFIYPNSVIETAPGVFVKNTSIPTGGPNDAAFLNYYSGNYSDIARNFVLDATALKVREITLSYDLPKSFLKSTGISNFKVSAIARNPFTVLSKQNRGYADPEASNAGGNTVGLSTTGNYPNTKTYGLSFNLTF